jgi:cyclophilin family peptidyl-prolyl cis-trans isomerase
MSSHCVTARRPFARATSVLAACLLLGVTAVAAAAQESVIAGPELNRVRIETTLGSFVIELETARAPLSSANFLSYVRSGHYAGVVFHRVINNFVVQAGGYDQKFELKAVGKPVPNESGNGLSNKRGTVGLARSEQPHSGNAQFYINLTDNDDLDPTPLRWGYAVFGKVVSGMDVVERIGRTPTGAIGPWTKDAPIEPVYIKQAEVIGETPAAAPAPAAPAVPPVPPPPGK